MTNKLVTLAKTIELEKRRLEQVRSNLESVSQELMQYTKMQQAEKDAKPQVTTIVVEKPDYESKLRRKEVMDWLGFKSPKGFTNFIQKYPDFPKEVRLSNGFNSHIYYKRLDVKNWLAKHNLSDALA